MRTSWVAALCLVCALTSTMIPAQAASTSFVTMRIGESGATLSMPAGTRVQVGEFFYNLEYNGDLPKYGQTSLYVYFRRWSPSQCKYTWEKCYTNERDIHGNGLLSNEKVLSAKFFPGDRYASYFVISKDASYVRFEASLFAPQVSYQLRGYCDSDSSGTTPQPCVETLTQILNSLQTPEGRFGGGG